MNKVALIIGSFYGLTAVALGALGSHALTRILTDAQLKSFETGVRYQMFHALVLLIAGYQLSFQTNLEKWVVICFSAGVLCFSLSIYLLCFSDQMKLVPKSIIGPITPIGGLLLLLGWLLLMIFFFKKTC